MRADPLAATLAVGAEAIGVPLTPAQISALIHYQHLMAQWNARARLTALSDPNQVIRLHFLDSLLCLRAPFPPRARVIDVGSGAGLPGIPLAIARPKFSITLLEPNMRKAAFLELAVSELGLDCPVVPDRAEFAGRKAEFRERFDVAAARALAGLSRSGEWTLPFVRVGGFAVLLKGPSVSAELPDAVGILAKLGGDSAQIIPAEVPGDDNRTIVVISKRSPTPSLYPRQASGSS